MPAASWAYSQWVENVVWSTSTSKAVSRGSLRPPVNVYAGLSARLARVASLLLGLAVMLPVAETRAQLQVQGLGGGGVLIGFPVGEFENFVDPSPGFSLYGLAQFGARGILGLRLDGSLIFYGSETRRRPLSPTIQLIDVDVTTQNTIASIIIGPQLSAPSGTVRPYVNAGLGFSYFSTESSVSGSSDTEPFASTTNFDDFTFALVSGGGVWIRLSRTVFLDLSGRYLRNGRVRYLREGSIIEATDGSISFTPIESETNMLLIQVGVSVSLGKGEEAP